MCNVTCQCTTVWLECMHGAGTGEQCSFCAGSWVESCAHLAEPAPASPACPRRSWARRERIKTGQQQVNCGHVGGSCTCAGSGAPVAQQGELGDRHRRCIGFVAEAAAQQLRGAREPGRQQRPAGRQWAVQQAADTSHVDRRQTGDRPARGPRGYSRKPVVD